MLNWGILTAGNIARAFAAGLKGSRTGQLVSVGARDLYRAVSFASEYGGTGYGSYEEVLGDPKVQAVYIATPHHLHAEWTVKAAQAGKAILCEKPFTLNAREAAEALDAVEKAGVFFMEAFMYRCSPQTRKIVELLGDGALGTVRSIDAEFSFAGQSLGNFRFDAAIGGGGLMDVGTYCVSFARLVAGAEPERVSYVANLDKGYDSYGAGVLQFPNGVVAKIASGVHLTMRNHATIYGEAGWLHVEDPWKSPPGSKMTLVRHGKEPEAWSLGCTGVELYANEADAVADYLALGECPFLTKQDTLDNMRCLDRLRESCGLRFSAEVL